MNNIELLLYENISDEKSFHSQRDKLIVLYYLYVITHKEKYLCELNSTIVFINNNYCGGLDTSVWFGLASIAYPITSLNYVYPEFCNQLISKIYLGFNYSLHSDENKNSYKFYDLFRGVSGTLRFLAENCMEDIQNELIENVEYLCELILYKGKMQVFNVSPEIYVRNHEKMKKYPNGYFDYGLSHGLAGVLASLSLSYTQGIQSEKILDCIYKLTKVQLESLMCLPSDRCIFPGRKSEKIDTKDFEKNYYNWCYGTIGILNSIILANKVLCDVQIKKIIINMINEMLSFDFKEENNLFFCHGLAGSALILYNWIPNFSKKKSYKIKKKAEDICNFIMSNIENKAFNMYEDAHNEFSIIDGKSSVYLVLFIIQNDVADEDVFSKMVFLK